MAVRYFKPNFGIKGSCYREEFYINALLSLGLGYQLMKLILVLARNGGIF
jgi:hypothetical protein